MTIASLDVELDSEMVSIFAKKTMPEDAYSSPFVNKLGELRFVESSAALRL